MVRDITAMPTSHVIACIAPYSKGGLGRHFSEWADACRSDGQQVQWISRDSHSTTPDRSLDNPGGTAAPSGLVERLVTRTIFRYSQGWTHCAENGGFDRRVAAWLPRPRDSAEFTGFGGMSLHSLRRARDLGYSRINLIAANSHVRNVQRLHDRALKRWPIESSWLNEHQVRRTIQEYEIADRIIVASAYTRETFLAEGVTESKLLRFSYKADPRFVPASEGHSDGTFRIVSTGSLTVMKGIPLLLEAFANLQIPSAQLTLVGGTGSPGMRRYLEQAIARDPRIRVAPGDPLPHLQRAKLFVHSSFEDGLAYAVLEALQCGVPTIVTADTGAKEYLRDSRHRTIPTGDADALLNAMRDAAAASTNRPIGQAAVT